MAHLTAKHKVKNVWGRYWKNYHGVTKIGAWSQKQAVNKVFSFIMEAKIDKNITVIDIGCGEGRTLLAFRKMGFQNSIGIDNVSESLKICQKKGLKIGKDIFLDDAFKTRYYDNRFTLVFSEGLLEHFKDPSPIIKEMARISNRYILLIQPNHFNLYGLAIAILGHFMRENVKEYTFSRNYFVKKFKEIGFSLKRSEYTLLGEFFILLFQKDK